jgi:pimeloyl-ACP methyl ester carboxylesterase
VDGIAMSHLRQGRGEPLVLIHGIGSRRQVWAPVLPDLVEHREVFAVDLPGFGASPVGEVVPTVAGYADALVGFCAAHGIERPHVAGNSLGGAVALELGRRGFARSIVAFAPIGFWGASGAVWCQSALKAMSCSE